MHSTAATKGLRVEHTARAGRNKGRTGTIRGASAFAGLVQVEWDDDHVRSAVHPHDLRQSSKVGSVDFGRLFG